MSAWDDVDRLRKEAEEKYRRENTPWCPRPYKKLSPDRARTLRAETRIANGFHPNGARLREPQPGEERGVTCGGCAHLREKETGARRTFFKCALMGDTNGPGTDIRKKWPACEFWKAKDGAP